MGAEQDKAEFGAEDECFSLLLEGRVVCSTVFCAALTTSSIPSPAGLETLFVYCLPKKNRARKERAMRSGVYLPLIPTHDQDAARVCIYLNTDQWGNDVMQLR